MSDGGAEGSPADLSGVLLSHPADGVLLVTLTRPDRLNALTEASLSALLTLFDGLRSDTSCRAVILTGSGRGFCAGLDVQESFDLLHGGAVSPDDLLATAARWSSLLPAMRAVPQVIVAAVNGPAVGGGLLLALGSDLRLATPETYFADGFVTVGLSGCELGVSWLLPRMIGISRATSLMLTGRKMAAAEALSCGLVEAIVDREGLVRAALDAATAVTRHSSFAVAMTKEVMCASQESPALSHAIALEARTQTLAILAMQAAERTRTGSRVRE